MMANDPEVLEVTAGEVADALKQHGVSADERVTITFGRELFPGRRESRKLVVAAGLTDDDIDRLIEQARQEFAPRLG
jgi:hypothetical protein